MAMYLPSLDCNRRYVLDGTLILSKTVYDMCACVVFTEGEGGDTWSFHCAEIMTSLSLL